jgi:hypothetical protein
MSEFLNLAKAEVGKNKILASGSMYELVDMLRKGEAAEARILLLAKGLFDWTNFVFLHRYGRLKPLDFIPETKFETLLQGRLGMIGDVEVYTDSWNDLDCRFEPMFVTNYLLSA